MLTWAEGPSELHARRHESGAWRGGPDSERQPDTDAVGSVGPKPKMQKADSSSLPRLAMASVSPEARG